jgi:hypothetical protein
MLKRLWPSQDTLGIFPEGLRKTVRSGLQADVQNLGLAKKEEELKRHLIVFALY